MKAITYKFIIVIMVGIIFGLLPFIFPHQMPLNTVQHILLVIFAMAAASWLCEPIPVYATSLAIMGALTLLISDSAITPIKSYIQNQGDQLLSYKGILNSFSSPIIILFLGGFALAIGSSKYKLDVTLAKILLKPFGKGPRRVMLGVMAITGCFAMFMSNTATTVMMLAMMTPVLSSIDRKDRGIKAMVLAIPFAANIGGIATPIGTPPNAIALSYLTGPNTVSFGHWVAYALPIAVVCIIATWVVLNLVFPFKEKEIKVTIESEFNKDWRTLTVYGTFLLTILLWMTEAWHGVNSYVVALIPIILFTTTGVMRASDIKSMNWDVIWLIAGGIALGEALSKTGLAEILAHIIDYEQLSLFMLVVAVCTIGWLISNFISNTATANLMIPIIFAVLSAYDFSAHPDGHMTVSAIIMASALAMSFGMTLPISTPPNSLAYATGLIKNRDMMLGGGIVSVMCLGINILALYFLG